MFWIFNLFYSVILFPQVVVEYKIKDASMNIINRVGKLSLIDLAGSERALATDQRTLRSLEGANINRSLLALSSCINALVEGKKHIPYRNSKLTQLLKDSLGGACNTVMIANISPSNLSFGETQNTLHWADRAKEIRNKVHPLSLSVLHYYSMLHLLQPHPLRFLKQFWIMRYIFFTKPTDFLVCSWQNDENDFNVSHFSNVFPWTKEQFLSLL